MTSAILKIGPKGQVLIKKEFREQLGILPGGFVEASLAREGLLLRAVDPAKELKRLREVRTFVTRHWPKGMDCVSATRDERR